MVNAHSCIKISLRINLIMLKKLAMLQNIPLSCSVACGAHNTVDYGLRKQMY